MNEPIQRGLLWAEETQATQGWKLITLEEFVSLQRGHDLPDPQRKPGRIPILGSFGITGYHDESKAKGPGVTIGRSGSSFGIVSYSPVDYWPLNTALYVTDFKGNDEKFTYYFLKSIDFAGFNSGSAQPSLNRNYIYPIPIKIPPLPEQRAIARILGSLDDKIEANRRMNETLEAMARTLFKSWFIDFDPVRARTEGRAPAGMDAETAALFPDGFEEQEGQMVPRGWRSGRLEEIAENPRRVVDPSEISSDIPYIGLEHMPCNSIALNEWGFSDGLESNKFQFEKGHILFGKLRPYFHKVGVAPINGICSTDILVIEPKKECWFAFVLGCVSSDVFVDYTNAASTGTKMPRTNWQDMAAYEIVIPSEIVASIFNSKIKPIAEIMLSNIHQSYTLSVIRDLLLPKLLSGKVSIKVKKNSWKRNNNE